MKKIIYLGLVLMTVISTLVSCQKEELPTTSENSEALTVDTENTSSLGKNFDKITIKDNRLSFESIAYYENLINHKNDDITNQIIDLVNTSNFQSYNKSNNRSNYEIKDDFIASILDENRIVKIGDWFIKINPKQEVVLAIHEKENNAYNSLVKANDESNTIHKFSTADNVLEYLSHPEQINNRALFCNDDGVGARSYTNHFVGYANHNDRIVLEHRKYGIWFKLQTKCYVISGFNKIIRLNYTNKTYKKTCKNIVNLPTGEVSAVMGDYYNNVISYGTRNYNKYHIKVSAQIFNNYTGAFIGSTGFAEIKANM